VILFRDPLQVCLRDARGRTQSAECARGFVRQSPISRPQRASQWIDRTLVANERKDEGCVGSRAPRPAFEETCPLVFDARGDGSGLSRKLSDGVLALLDELRFEAVQAEPSFDRLELVQGLRAEQVPQTGDSAAPALSERRARAVSGRRRARG
jgi:hypothetical protein